MPFGIECFVKDHKQICTWRDGDIAVDLPALARVDPNHVDVAIGPTNDAEFQAWPYASFTCSRDIHGAGKDDNDYQCTIVSHIADYDSIVRSTGGCDNSCRGRRSTKDGATVMSIQCEDNSNTITVTVHDKDISPFHPQATMNGEPFDPRDS